MREFDHSKRAGSLLTPSIVNQLSAIHEYKGSQSHYIEAQPDLLTGMLEVAKIQSTESSNKIEGIATTQARLREITLTKSAPRNRDEQEIAGYRDVLATIHENYDFIPPRPNLILQLHRDLYRYSGSSIGGRFKNADNVIEETDSAGNKTVRFIPLPAFETPEAMDRLCDTFLREIDRGEQDPLLLIALFVLDFLCIHPFSDGNGRMSRLLTLLLLYRAGYLVGKYISIEMLIEKTKESYYDALQASSLHWIDQKNDDRPFVCYTLGIVLSAYREFSDRVAFLSTKNNTPANRIRGVLESHLGKLSLPDIAAFCPDIGEETIERALAELLANGDIYKVGSGSPASYVYQHDPRH
jgi:Fic family protein